MNTPNLGLKLNLYIGSRLALGFLAIAIVLAAAVGMTLFKTESINSNMQRISELRVPTAEASAGGW